MSENKRIYHGYRSREHAISAHCAYKKRFGGSLERFMYWRRKLQMMMPDYEFTDEERQLAERYVRYIMGELPPNSIPRYWRGLFSTCAAVREMYLERQRALQKQAAARARSVTVLKRVVKHGGTSTDTQHSVDKTEN